MKKQKTVKLNLYRGRYIHIEKKPRKSVLLWKKQQRHLANNNVFFFLSLFKKHKSVGFFQSFFDYWLRVRRSNFMRSKFNFFMRSNFWSWGWNWHFSWDQIFLQNWSGDRIGPRGPRGTLFQVVFSNLT